MKNWFKNKSIPINILFTISYLLTGCSNIAVAGNEIKAAAIPDTPVQPSQKVLADGQVLTRHGGDAWSRWKIREYLTHYILQLDLRRSGGPVKEICPEIAADLKALQFVFFKPDLVVDDWEDPRLEPYKQKYEKFKYPLGYRPNYGTNQPIPTWNITVYDLDTNQDGKNEAILYGEKYIHTSLGGLAYGYQVFESNINWRIGELSYGDPSSVTLGPDDYVLSALIKIRGVDAVLNVNDYTMVPGRPDRILNVLVFWLNLQDIARKEPVYHINRCYFDLNPGIELEKIKN